MKQSPIISDDIGIRDNPERMVDAMDRLVFEEIKSAMSSGTLIRENEALGKHTTLRVGGSADLYVEPSSEAELAAILRLCAPRQVPVTVIGRGSNLLVRDGGVRGVVLCLMHSNFSRIETTGYRMHCGAGAKLKQVAQEAKKARLTGLEFLEGIPGTVGGGLRMNAGAMGGWMFDVVESVRYMERDGQVRVQEAAALKVEYRSCPFLKENIALGAVLKGHPAAREVVEKRMRTFSQKRWDTQPAAPSAGCIFKNPGTVPAGKLIDELGLKGKKIGGAMISHEHGNFIVNEGNASAKDVLDLIDLIRQKARGERSIELETEVEIIGEG